jgi:pimeloyl-ACP methyl ester carboxylesterase
VKVTLFEQVPYRYVPDGFENHHSSANMAEELGRGGGGGMLSRLRTASYRKLVDTQVAIVGSPATVADDCGHVVQADQPEHVWAALSRFLPVPKAAVRPV